MADNFKSCSIADCNGNAHWTAKGARGWCAAHYWRWRKNGDPLGGRTGPGEPLDWIERTALTHQSDDCLPWPFGTSGGRYGQLTVDGRRVLAHRLICELSHGAPPTPDHQAAHNCGNGHLGCVNPGHLRWATGSENQMDRVDHGTSNRGERHAHTRLTESVVREIRELSKTMPPKQIAERLGVDRKRVSAIAKRTTWAWLK